MVTACELVPFEVEAFPYELVRPYLNVDVAASSVFHTTPAVVAVGVTMIPVAPGGVLSNPQFKLLPESTIPTTAPMDEPFMLLLSCTSMYERVRVD